MKGDGGKFGQLGLANGEPREGSAPSPRPRPPRLPQRECVRLAHCAWRLGPRQAVRELQQPAAATAASRSHREQRRGGTGRKGASPAPLAQPSPTRLPPHAGAGAAAAAAAAATAARREGGGRNPACSTRAPSWTIMIPSKPTTTCSRKRTGIETCSWTRPGRSSRERSAAAPARRSTPARPAPLAALRAPGSERVPGSHERGRGMRGRCERWGVGLQARAEGEPFSRARERRSLSVGRWGRPRAGRLGVRDSGHRVAAAPSPRGQGVEGGAWEAGAEPWRGGCLLRIDFPFPSPPPGRLSIWRAVAARFPGRPGLVPAGGEQHGTLHLPTPARRPRGKRAPQGLAAASESASRGSYWNGLGLRKLARGDMRVPQLALWGRGQEDQPFYCLTQLRAEMGLRLRPAGPTPLTPGRRRIWAT